MLEYSYGNDVIGKRAIRTKRFAIGGTTHLQCALQQDE